MGEWKPLLPLVLPAGKGQAPVHTTIVGAAVGAALASGLVGRVLLVTGFRGDELEALFSAEPRVEPVRNPAWELGMLGSIQKALPLVKSGCFFCLNADMPFVDPGSFARLAEAMLAEAVPAGREAAVFASHEGLSGHPVLVPSAWIREILLLDPGARMKSYLESRPHFSVECGPGSLLDLDTRECYEAFRAGGAG